MRWSGINSFNTSINLFSSNIQNDVPFLSDYFNSSNPAFEQITDASPSSLYSQSQIFDCLANLTQQLPCPFANSSTCSSPYEAQFQVEYCSESNPASAESMISREMLNNSTQWFEGTLKMAELFDNLSVPQSEITNMVNEVQSFTALIGNYENEIQDGIDFGSVVIKNLEIAFYVFYGFILLMGLVGIVSLCMAYLFNIFKCRYLMYIIWYVFFLLSLLLFVTSGIFLTTSIFTYDTCVAYPYFFNNQTNFKNLHFEESEIGDVFNTCFFTTDNQTSIFSALNKSTILESFGTINSEYEKTMPSP